MSLVKRNVLANLAGGALITVLTAIITPLQINILGLASFGIVSFISTLQIAFALFDLGLSSTIARELAIDSSLNKMKSAQLLRTASTIFWFIAIAIGALIASLSSEISQRWFSEQNVGIQNIEQSLQVIALFLALRWPVSLYTGVLIGLQRMDLLNAVKVVTVSVRLIGGVVVLLHWRTLNSFLIWTAISALIEVLSYWLICRWVHPTLPWRFGISFSDLQRVWRFSATMNGLAIMSILVGQADRLLISNNLTLKDLGSYSLAYNAAAIMPALISAISTAVLPSFTEAYGVASKVTLLHRIENASRFIMFAIGLVTGCLVFFGKQLLTLWVNPDAAAAAAVPLAWLAIGFFGSAATSNAYQLTVASGRAYFALRISVLTALPYFVVLYVLISLIGIAGAALAWLLLNLVYVLYLVPKVYKDILGEPVTPFLLQVLVPFGLLVFCTFGLAHVILGESSLISPFGIIIFTSTLLIYALLGYFLLGHELRNYVRSTLRLT